MEVGSGYLWGMEAIKTKPAREITSTKANDLRELESYLANVRKADRAVKPEKTMALTYVRLGM